jgi:hypothetical protein
VSSRSPTVPRSTSWNGRCPRWVVEPPLEFGCQSERSAWGRGCALAAGRDGVDEGVSDAGFGARGEHPRLPGQCPP